MSLLSRALLFVSTIAFLFTPATLSAQVTDPRDPARLTTEFIRTTIATLDADRLALRSEVEALWNQAIAQAATSQIAADLTQKKTTALANFDLRTQRLRWTLEKTIAVAKANKESAFGLVVPFFATLNSVSDTRPGGTANTPVVITLSATFFKPLPRVIKSADGEFDYHLDIVGADPEKIASVDLAFVEAIPPIGSRRLSHLPFMPPGTLETATSDNTLAATRGTSPTTVEQKILTQAYLMRATTRFTDGSTVVSEGRVAIRDLTLAPPPLAGLVPPLAPNIGDFVIDQAAAIQLGKAFFWDVQVSSDNTVACASCHNEAGVDPRSRNQFSLDPVNGIWRGLGDATVTSFPLPVGQVFGSQGVINQDFIGINVLDLNSIDIGVAPSVPTIFDPNVQVTKRNSPSTINAAFNDRQFWDGRAARYFNGANIHGELDPSAFVYKAAGRTRIDQVKVLLDGASLASQAIGPILSGAEMSWSGRGFHHMGQKLLPRSPLVYQQVAATDSVLGALPIGGGKRTVTYADMIRKAFRSEWWDSTKTVTIDGEVATLMEANFQLFFGLSVYLYERTLVSDVTRYDAWASGTNPNALTALELEGLELFLTTGKCVDCHNGPLFTSATRDLGAFDPIELMQMPNRTTPTNYDTGFYNIGASPQANDIGQGATTPFGVPLSYTRQAGATPDAIDGAFKTPTLRNIDLTAPYLHNGRYATLTSVVEFYLRGGDHNNPNLHPDMLGITLPPGTRSRNAMVAFMKALTDERVRYERAPFDHPSLVIPNGAVLPAVGAGGRTAPITGFLGRAGQ